MSTTYINSDGKKFIVKDKKKINKFDYHIILFKLNKYWKKYQNDIKFRMKIIESHFIDLSDDSLPEHDNDGKPIFIPEFTLAEVDTKIRAIKKSLPTLEIFVKRLEESDIPYDLFSDRIDKIRRVIRNAKMQLEILRTTPTIDKPSRLKDVEFTGISTGYWYEKAFTNLLIDKRIYAVENLIHFLDINKNAKSFSISIGHVHGKEKFVEINYDDVLKITNQIRIIKAVTDSIKSNRMNESQKSRINRAIYKLHHEFQISPTILVKILVDRLGLLQCYNTCIMKRSEFEFEKHDTPKWLLDYTEKNEKS